ncbi:MAG: hypothetical protein ACR2N3_18030 [Pyrinomonadaceae bacterium]
MKQSAYATNSKIPSAVTRKDELLIQTFAKVDRGAFGIAIGIIFGAGIFLATNFLILKGGERVGPTFALLNQYFIGFSVTFAGSFIGLIYGFASGFILGWLLAFLRNLVIKIYLHVLKFKGRIAAIGGFLDE